MTTSVPFLVFPGVAGNFIETADTNELDADTAHVQQSIGQAVNGFQAGSIQLSTDLAPVFGSSHGEATSSGTGPVVSLGPTSGSGIVPVTAGNTYAFAASMACAVATDAQLAVRWFDSGGGIISTPNVGSSVVLSPNAFAALTADAVAPSGAASCSLRLVWDNGVGAGDKVYWDAAMVAAGSIQAFVPSLQIVGDLDMRADVAATDYTPPSNQSFIDKTGSAKGYKFYLGTARLSFVHATGGAYRFVVASVPLATANGVRSQLRVTLNTSTGDVTFYENASQLGGVQSSVAGPIESDNGQVLGIGATQRVSEFFAGSMWSAEVRDGIDGPVVARCDASDAATATVT